MKRYKNRGVMMNNLKLNKTPVRTCNNYLMNDIELKHVDIPKNIEKFNNVIFQDFDENIKILNQVKNNKIKYGNGMEEQFEKANIKLTINISKNSDKPNIINFIFDEKNNNLIDNIEINIKENVKANIVIRYAINSLNNFSNSNLRFLSNTKCNIYDCRNDDCLINLYNAESNLKNFYHNGMIKTNLKENAKLNLTVENLLGKNAVNFINFDNEIGDFTNLEYNYIDFGGDIRVINYYCNVVGKKAVNKLNSLYLGEKQQILDYNYIAEIYGKESDVNFEVQGAIKENAHKNFKGTIDFKSGCTKSKGAENEFCTLLSDTAKALSLPMLLCTEEDVEGAHSTAAGKVDSQELFYIMTRGFTRKEAEKLLIRANFNEIIEGIMNEEIKKEIIEHVNYRL